MQVLTPPEPDRDPYLDNVKGVLIVLVVIGHTLGQTLGSYPRATYAYTWVYLFHMPAFAFVCGLLGANGGLDGRRSRALLRNLVAPYLVFQALYSLLWQLNGERLPHGLDLVLTPVYHLWFLVALVAWRLLTPVLQALRHPVLVTTAVGLLGVTSQLLGDGLALNRVVAFLPFFTLGLVHGTRLVAALERPAWRLAAAPLLALSAAGAVVYTRRYGAAHWPRSAHDLHVSVAEGLLQRAGLIALAAAMVVVVLVLTPRRRTSATAWGTYSLYPFLLHAFVVRLYGWHGSPADRWWEVALLVLAAVGLTALLSSALARRVFAPLVQPRARWLTGDPEDAPRDALRVPHN